MARFYRKIVLITSPSIIFILLVVINAQANNVMSSGNSLTSNTIYHFYVPAVVNPWRWQVLQVVPPLSYTSLYIKNTVDFTYSRLYQLGCELGTRDYNLDGAQNTFVLLEFGTPYFITNESRSTVFGVQRINTDEFHSIADIREAALGYAQGYYNCSVSDVTSHVTIAVGTNNWDNQETPEDYVTYAHGAAWGNLILDLQNQLTSSEQGQISFAGGSDLELDWNDPAETRAWVDGFISIVYQIDLYGNGHILSDFYDIGDAAGCPFDPTVYAPGQSYWYEACGTVGHPGWTAWDVVYLGNRPGGKLMPMVYSHDNPPYSTADGWVSAAEWQGLAMFNWDQNGYKLVFAGSTTQKTACVDQNIPLTNELCATPAEGYTKLYSALNSFTKTQTQSLSWSTDMHWIPIP